MTTLTDREIDRIAQVNFESLGIRAGFNGEYAKPWASMRDWEKERYRRAALAVYLEARAIAAVKSAEAIVGGRAA